MPNHPYKHGPELSKIEAEPVRGLSLLQSYIYRINLPDESIDRIMAPDPALLHSPFQLPDLDAAVKKISTTITNGGHILLYGDRDSDGVIATSIFGMELKKMAATTGSKISIRTTSADDDYGLCPKCVESIISIKPDLLVTIDFGSSNFTEINFLKANGIDVIVLDHHEIPESIPDSLLINPKRKDSLYPYKNICSAVLSWKIVLALHFYNTSEYNKHYWLAADENNLSGELFKNGVSLFTGKLEEAKLKFPDGYYHFPPGVARDNPAERIFHFQTSKKSTVFQQMAEYISLSAIGTITDLMLLTGENRIIVAAGIIEMRKLFQKETTKLTGLKSLLTNLGLHKNKISSRDLGWLIGPAINAAGRMGKSEFALNLLLAEDMVDADLKSKDLIQLNQERKERTKRNLDRADEYLKTADNTHPVIFCYTSDMEPGVSGIVASKLVNQFRKPAVFISHEKEYAKGSARSANNENVLVLIGKLGHHLIQFGGHQEAAGFSLHPDNIDKFRDELIRVSYEWSDEKNATDAIESLICLHPHELNGVMFRELSLFEPFGQGNQSPMISVDKAKILGFKPMGNGEHASFRIQGSDVRFIIWNRAVELDKFLSSRETVSLWGYLEENFFNSRSTIQFSVIHYQ